MNTIGQTGRRPVFSTTTIFGTPVDITLSERCLPSGEPLRTVGRARLRALAVPVPGTGNVGL
jgi:hypothetical protein